MSHNRATSVTVHFAPTNDMVNVKLQDYKTPQEFRNAFRREADGLSKRTLTYHNHFAPKFRPKSDNQKIDFNHPLTYSAE